jgi:hypothetical protein
VIAAIRQVYTGKLVYAANATFTGDEFTSVSFWDKVDLLGIDGYFPLTNHADPTLAELVSAWRNNEFGEDLVATVQNFSDAHQKPLIFTELGYKSVAGANTQPFNFTFPGAFDLTEQQNCYTAFYTVWPPESSWMLGIFWWAWPVPPPAANDTDYNPRGKPVETVLKTFQGPPSGAPGFHLAANPESISVVQGTSATSVIAINASGGFANPVNLSVSGLPSGVTATLNPAVVTGTTGLVTFNVASTVPVGTTSTVTVVGTSGSITSAVAIKLAVITPDFSLSASPSQLNVHQGGSATSTINVTQIGGFAGSVTFSASNLPSGVTAVFSPASTNGSFSTVTFTASSGAAVISSSVLITGASGNLTHTTSINLTVQPPLNDFALTADSPTIVQGGSGSTTVTVTPQGIFSGSVALSAGGVPGGVTAMFAPASTTTSSTLTFTATSTASLGIATISITGTSGGISHTITIHLTVNQVQNPDFSLSGTNVSVTQGGTGTSAISVTPLGGFAGSVALTASGFPSGVTAVFSPASTTGTSTLTFTASGTATTGPANVTITGTSGTLSHTATITLTVNAVQVPNFTLAGTNCTAPQGGTGTCTITITPSGSFNGSVALSATGLPTGVSAAFSPNPATVSAITTITLTFNATAAAATGTFPISITATSGALTHSTSISLTVTPAVTGTGGVTVTTVINSNSAFFNDQGVKVANPAAITALSVTITVKATPGVTFSGQYNTVGGSILQSHSGNASAITYQYTLAAGQTLSPGTGWLFDAQMGGNGTLHPTSGDTFTVTYTTGGATFTQSGHF